MVIDAWAGEEHHVAHILPIWEALDPHERGTFHTSPPAPSDVPTMVSSYKGYQECRRPIVYLEHGAGQRYPNANRAFAGAAERDRVVLFLNPNDETTRVNRDAHPTVPSVTVGTPYLDRFTPRERTGRTVAFSWHWMNGYWPASCSAFRYYRRGLPDVFDRLRSEGWEVIGTAHPRAWRKPPGVGPFYEQHGIEAVHDLGEVIERADVLCADNTSAQWLTAAMGVRQVVLDCPDYRQGYDLQLWPRFSVPLGVHVSDADMIPVAVERAKRLDVSEVVPFTDGRCADRAVAALRTHVLRSQR